MAKADRTGNRIPRSAFKKRIPDLGRYFIYTDADGTEEKYMYGLMGMHAYVRSCFSLPAFKILFP